MTEDDRGRPSPDSDAWDLGQVVEVDGDIHDYQADYDAERDRVFAQRGLRTLRIANDDVFRNIEDVLAKIAAACRSNA